MITDRPATEADIKALELRPEDAAEVSPDWRIRAIYSLRKGALIQAYLDGDKVVALCGLTEGPMFAGPWLLCSPEVENHKAYVWRKAKRLVGILRDNAKSVTVGNYIGKASRSNRRFIQALGFVILVAPTGDHDFFYLPHV
jgi:hypothetical protein